MDFKYLRTKYLSKKMKKIIELSDLKEGDDWKERVLFITK